MSRIEKKTKKEKTTITTATSTTNTITIYATILCADAQLSVIFMFVAAKTAAPTTTTLPTSEFAFAVLFIAYASNNVT